VFFKFIAFFKFQLYDVGGGPSVTGFATNGCF